jgi:hypothetical protein
MEERSDAYERKRIETFYKGQFSDDINPRDTIISLLNPADNLY